MTRAQLVSKAKEVLRKRAARTERISETTIQEKIDEAIKGQYLRLATAEMREAYEREMRSAKTDYDGPKSSNISDRLSWYVS
jgi:hypothetical protein